MVTILASCWIKVLERRAKIILGGPGTGKTHRLMEIVDQHISEGIEPAKIAFLSFTKKGAEVASSRAMEKFHLEKAPNYFRTIHSLAYHELGLNRSEVLTRGDMKEISNITGVKVTFSSPADGDILKGAEGDKYLNIISLSRATGLPLESISKEYKDHIDPFELKMFHSAIEQYKTDTHKVDFADMLVEYIEHGEKIDIDVLIVDEAQDLSATQWKLIKKIAEPAKYIYFAGDDDQSIYRWSGADVDFFISLGNKYEVEVLPLSFRLPDEIFKQSMEVAKRISKRYSKKWRPAGHKGSVEWISTPEDLNLREGEWMLLARNFVFTTQFAEQAKLQGVPFLRNGKSSVDANHIKAIQVWERLRRGGMAKPEEMRNLIKMVDLQARGKQFIPQRGSEYSWKDLLYFGAQDLIWHEGLNLMNFEDRAYYLEILKNGFKLTETPKVSIGTIHSVKGDEADNVVVATDVTWRSYQAFMEEPDDEHRVFYVGLTRARQNLKIMSPQSSQWYDM